MKRSLADTHFPTGFQSTSPSEPSVLDCFEVEVYIREMANPNAPPETSAEIWFEQSNFVSVYIGTIAYGECHNHFIGVNICLILSSLGVHIAVFFICVYYLVTERKKNCWKWLAYIAVLFSMATVNICLNMHFSEMAWIDDRDYPGGPLAFLLEQQSDSMNTVGNSVSFVATFLADGLLVCYLFSS